MKFEDVNAKIDQFFESVTPNDVVKLFEGIGYEFDRKLSPQIYNVTIRLNQNEVRNNLFHYKKHLVEDQIDHIIIKSIDSLQNGRSMYMLAKKEDIPTTDKETSFEGSGTVNDFSNAA